MSGLLESIGFAAAMAIIEQKEEDKKNKEEMEKLARELDDQEYDKNEKDIKLIQARNRYNLSLTMVKMTLNDFNEEYEQKDKDWWIIPDYDELIECFIAAKIKRELVEDSEKIEIFNYLKTITDIDFAMSDGYEDFGAYNNAYALLSKNLEIMVNLALELKMGRNLLYLVRYLEELNGSLNLVVNSYKYFEDIEENHWVGKIYEKVQKIMQKNYEELNDRAEEYIKEIDELEEYYRG